MVSCQFQISEHERKVQTDQKSDFLSSQVLFHISDKRIATRAVSLQHVNPFNPIFLNLALQTFLRALRASGKEDLAIKREGRKNRQRKDDSLVLQLVWEGVRIWTDKGVVYGKCWLFTAISKFIVIGELKTSKLLGLIMVNRKKLEPLSLTKKRTPDDILKAEDPDSDDGPPANNINAYWFFIAMKSEFRWHCLHKKREAHGHTGARKRLFRVWVCVCSFSFF